MDDMVKNVILNILDEVISFTPYGLSEDCYETAFCMECDLRKINYTRQKSFPIYYKNEFLTYYTPDLVLKIDDVESTVIEFKAQKTHGREQPQLIKYLQQLDKKEIVLINFFLDEMTIFSLDYDENNKPILLEDIVERS